MTEEQAQQLVYQTTATAVAMATANLQIAFAVVSNQLAKCQSMDDVAEFIKKLGSAIETPESKRQQEASQP